MIVLHLDENKRYQHGIREIKLSEIGKDITGVTLYFMEGPAFSLFDQRVTRKLLEEHFPNHYVESNRMKVSLGEFIDLLSKIK